MKHGFEIIDQRKSRRFLGRVGIMTSDDDGLNFGVLTSLSRTGAYLEFQKPKAVGAEFSFVLSNGHRRETMVGEVTRVDTSLFLNKPSGMAIRFLPLDISAKRLRDDMMMFLMLQSYSPFSAA